MNELVFLKNNQPVTTSLIIAEGTGNQHESIIRLINEHKAHFERWGKIYFSDLKSGNPQGGRRYPIYLMNRDELSLLAMGFTGKKALQFIARTIIAGLLAKGADYHQPYRDCQSVFDSYARLSFINQRLLHAQGD